MTRPTRSPCSEEGPPRDGIPIPPRSHPRVSVAGTRHRRSLSGEDDCASRPRAPPPRRTIRDARPATERPAFKKKIIIRRRETHQESLYGRYSHVSHYCASVTSEISAIVFDASRRTSSRGEMTECSMKMRRLLDCCADDARTAAFRSSMDVS